MTGPNTLKCPHCGNSDLDEIQHVERACNYRNLCRCTQSGQIYIDEFIQDTDTMSWNELICLVCCERFPLPPMEMGRPHKETINPLEG